ncbi:T9SS type A sorting domain-containing protein [Candidatus Sulfidibacterium hydrothermale]|nr:T9SS type A sorting domain-containing protein [Candidatus Sulfidibacterium hydrothermale]UBM61988.1 T9SS type A sorting domain-containing protein [Candidatus Sulfidibacterium hydrothermale]
MKKFLALFLTGWIFSAMPVFSQSGTALSPFRNESTLSWNTPNGLPYVKSFSGNYSVEVFRDLDENHRAFLSRAKQALFLFNMATEKKEKVYPLPFSPVDFTVFRGDYYIAGTQYLYRMTPDGKITGKWFFGGQIRFVENIRTTENHLYLISPDQKSWEFDPARGIFDEEDGIILQNNLRGKVRKLSSRQFRLMIYGNADTLIARTITVQQPLGSVKLLGIYKDRLYVEVQQIQREFPLKVKREIYLFEYANNRFSQNGKILMPDVYYTYIKHDVNVSKKGVEIYVSTPEKAAFFRENTLGNLKSGAEIRLPENLYRQTYLYNNHLLPAIESDGFYLKNMALTPITRQKILQNAEPYATHKWYCHPANIWDRDCGGVHVKTPSWVTVGNNVSIPYMWGGFSSLKQFDQGIADGVSAGDCDTHGNGAGPSCAVGVDCSGFVSRAWGLGNKYSTRTIPDISTEYPSYDDLKPGDVVNYAGHHVRLIHSVNGNGTFLIIEAAASSTDWRVGYNNYSVADFQGRYLPRRYIKVIEGETDSVRPVTHLQVKIWETGNFQADFTDKDNTGVTGRFYHVGYFDGKHWTAAVRTGFFEDHFNGTLSAGWKKISGNWNIVNGVLNQSDETNSNTNIYFDVEQNASKTAFLYTWRMKIGGSGDNRRAGLIFMSDNPALSQRNNAYMVYFRVDQNTCQIYKSENNSIHLKTSDACDVPCNQWFDAKVLYKPYTGEIDVFKNDTLVSTWVDATPLINGKSISLRTGNANVSYDDITVYRSRKAEAPVTTGENGMVPVQNTAPDMPACRILSLVSDSMHNLSAVDTAFVNIDWTKPSGFSVSDGLDDADLDSTHVTTKISGHWASSSDINSGIAAYRYCVGTAPGHDDIVGWRENQLKQDFTVDGLSLTPGDTCYISVVAINGASLVSDTMVSDGVRILQPLAVGNYQQSGRLSVFPVPVENHLVWLKTTQKITEAPVLMNLSGKMLPVKTEQAGKYLWKMDVTGIPPGIYFVRVKTQKGFTTQKLLITRQK